MSHQTFEESQRFNQVWIWVLLIGVSILVIVQVPLDLIKSTNEESLPTHSIIVLLLSIAFVIGLNALFFFSKLKTNINTEGVSVVFHPFFNKPKLFRWEDIEKAFVRKYQPLWEYGGWGIRFGMKGRAYNTSGNKGLQLIMKSGKKILIGTQKSDELDGYLKKYIFTNQDNY